MKTKHYLNNPLIIKNLKWIYYFVFSVLIIFFSNIHAQDVISQNGMVASAHPLATKAGLEILQAGGNAVDAAVATAFALAVVEPNASGLGGGGWIAIKMAGSTDGITIDYRESAPAAATPELYYGSDQSFNVMTHSGARAAGVPGVVAGLSRALEQYGTMSFAQVAEPAIAYAQNGFEISEKFEEMIIQAYDLISLNAATSDIYLVDGLPPSQGNIIKNPDLAETFKKIAEKGSACFYNGEIAQSIINTMKEEDGILTMEDLNKYEAITKVPVKGTYRGYQVLTTAPPTGGGTHLVEMLNILEQYDLLKMKHNSADYIHILAEAMKICLADKSENMADPAFYMVPVEKMTSKDYAKDLFKFINLERARFDYSSPKMLSRESESTTHLSVVDKDNNIVALTQSINLWFGSGVTVAGTGMLLNNHLADFSSVKGNPNSIEPKKRPVSSIAPTILLKKGKPFLTIGTPGGSRIIGALAQIIINIIDFNMGIDEAIEAPRFHAYDKVLHIEGRIRKDVQKQLEKYGHTLKIHKDFDNYFGGAQGILVDTEKHTLSGGADSRRDGMAMGY